MSTTRLDEMTTSDAMLIVAGMIADDGPHRLPETERRALEVILAHWRNALAKLEGVN